MVLRDMREEAKRYGITGCEEMTVMTLTQVLNLFEKAIQEYVTVCRLDEQMHDIDLIKMGIDTSSPESMTHYYPHSYDTYHLRKCYKPWVIKYIMTKTITAQEILPERFVEIKEVFHISDDGKANNLEKALRESMQAKVVPTNDFETTTLEERISYYQRIGKEKRSCFDWALNVPDYRSHKPKWYRELETWKEWKVKMEGK